MNLADGSLSLFYLADILLVLAVVGLAGWLGPRVALSRWRSSRRVDRKAVETPPAEQPQDSLPSLDYQDAVCATDVSDIRSRPWSFPESSDPLTLRPHPEAEHVETRRAYLKLLQCYSKKSQPSVTPPEQEVFDLVEEKPQALE